ncbi:hypothetical protein [Paenibacillus xylanivorans]|uniref:Uncharacterized protein n=1 Tax=Paenibacillus xylanivorans TaxID=1705561 RepID=A0A0M9BLK5_9BACL|nr:hypothetical protein [Paenibacillus xylanivorans]KOY13802.1 hypothetical protein AMS66_25735 [Paenibacillus xylanivorans]
MKRIIVLFFIVFLTACGNSQNSSQVIDNIDETYGITEEEALCNTDLSLKDQVLCMIDNQMYYEAIETIESSGIKGDKFLEVMRSYSNLFLERPSLEELEAFQNEFLSVHSKVLKLLEANEIGLNRMSTMTGNLKSLLEARSNQAINENNKANGYVEVYIGMTAEELKNSKLWGEPDTVNRTTTKYGVSEQWVYGNSRYVYLEEGIVTSIQE